MVKALECGQEGCGFKRYLGHSTQNFDFGDSKPYDVSG